MTSSVLSLSTEHLQLNAGTAWCAAAVSAGKPAYLRHLPSGLMLSVRRLPAPIDAGLNDLPAACRDYLDLSWPSARWVLESWRNGPVCGISAVSEDAMPEVLVREWMVTDGRHIATASSFAKAQEWDAAIEEAERLVRSIAFNDPE